MTDKKTEKSEVVPAHSLHWPGKNPAQDVQDMMEKMCEILPKIPRTEQFTELEKREFKLVNHLRFRIIQKWLSSKSSTRSLHTSSSKKTHSFSMGGIKTLPLRYRRKYFEECLRYFMANGQLAEVYKIVDEIGHDLSLIKGK